MFTFFLHFYSGTFTFGGSVPQKFYTKCKQLMIVVLDDDDNNSNDDDSYAMLNISCSVFNIIFYL